VLFLFNAIGIDDYVVAAVVVSNGVNVLQSAVVVPQRIADSGLQRLSGDCA
jgi:hypothetical protein